MNTPENNTAHDCAQVTSGAQVKEIAHQEVSGKPYNPGFREADNMT